ncbi:adenylate/guanylate cyclase domain-containing protein [Methylocystis heyeri]|uniref:2Fe-2S iron-sulfur cluster binding domain-containing protein n=1 Tax=Methylocystis heyeri TaxID=391905 RepID=A0A6B8KI30_9HYPH|nr:adenylate/guanylate cyclase domain-containing protein [Methylocystis heyeri]QGM47282.1 2Fe-2S iron-sulfur cluster binding domain-containing protein [Methylocystis heyeri]
METQDHAAEWSSRLERFTRLATGLLLMGFAGSHFLSHATGLFGLEGIERFGRGVIMAPWRTGPGRWLLLAALLIHLGLGLIALLRRRHLRMPAVQAVQYGLGLLIPLLILPHAVNVRLGYSFYSLDDSYYRILYQYWISSPAAGLTRQFFLMLALWTHGCIGIHMWLRYRPSYRKFNKTLLGLAIAAPVLGMFGIMNAGWDEKLRSVTEPGFAALHGAPHPGTVPAARLASLVSLSDQWRVAYLALIGAVFATRGLRQWRARRGAGVQIRYLGTKTVTAPRGFSILEASIFNHIPHVSLCGGKARCTTCRVRVVDGGEQLPPPNAIERATLERVGAPEGVRLACQTRPLAHLTVEPLVPASVAGDAQGVAFEHGGEMLITAMFVDLRDSTRLAAGRLPFDTLFIVNRFIKAVTGGIEAHGGYVTSVAGDGVMSAFGVNGNGAEGASGAIAAALDIWKALERLNYELEPELKFPLRFGIGVHTGLAVVGAIASSGRSSLQFLGDTGNVAQRLEAATKDRGCVMIASNAAFAAAGLNPGVASEHSTIVVRGLEGAEISVRLFRERESVLDDPHQPGPVGAIG